MIKEISKSKIRFFPLHTRDMAMISFYDLNISHLLTLLIDKLGFNLNNIKVEKVFQTKKYLEFLSLEVEKCEEEYLVFFLENSYHSSDFGLKYLQKILKYVSKNKNNPKIIIHSYKSSNNQLLELMNNYNNIVLCIQTDIEYFFNEYFYKGVNINDISNIIYRNSLGDLIINKYEEVNYNLNDYLLGAYHSKYYSHFYKSKDYISSFLDDDIVSIGKSYYGKSKKEKILSYRYSSEDIAILSTGRGCKYKCTYCFRGAKFSDVRQISIETIKKDLDYLSELKYREIYLYDDCFITTNLNRLKEITDLLGNYDFYYSIALRYEVCNKENLNFLSNINIKNIQVGLQSISLESNLDTKRSFNKKLFEDFYFNTKGKNISISLDIILGLPKDGLKGFIKTFNYALTLRPNIIVINSLFLNPGTEIYNNKDKYEIEVYENDDLFHVDGVKSSKNFTHREVLIARKYVNYFINKNTGIEIILR